MSLKPQTPHQQFLLALALVNDANDALALNPERDTLYPALKTLNPESGNRQLQPYPSTPLSPSGVQHFLVALALVNDANDALARPLPPQVPRASSLLTTYRSESTLSIDN